MEIKNLAQLKKAIGNKTPFVILKHYVRPEFEGQIRVPSVVQTNSFYSVIQGDPDHEVSKFNGGKGSWLEYGKASDWVFENGVCKQFVTFKDGFGNPQTRPIWEIKFQ